MATVTPANGAGSIAIAAGITVAFSEAVHPATVTATTFTVTPQGGTPVAATVSASGTAATLAPASPLQYGKAYTIDLTTGIRDLSGNALVAFQSTFTTVGAPETNPPVVTSVTPGNGAAGVPVSTTVSVTFSAPVTPASVTASAFTLSPSGGNPVAASLAYDGNLTAVLTPASPLAFGAAYTVNLTAGIVNSAGLTLTPHQSGFTTQAVPDSAPPHVTAIVPADGATNISIASTIQVTFNEAVSFSQLDETTFKVTDGGQPLPGTVVYDAATRKATFTPAATLAYLTAYTVTLGAGIQDAAGNTLTAAASSAAFTSSFTTTALPDVTPPAVNGITPPDGASGIALNASMTALFSEPLNPQTVNTTTFLVNNGNVSGTVTYNGLTNSAIFTPNALASGTTYTVTLRADIRDAAGNRLGTDYSWQFTTVAAPDTTPPGVVARSPLDGATDVSVGLASVTATFSEALRAGSVNDATFRLAAGDAQVGGTVTYDANNKKAIFTLAGELAASTLYTATLTSGITDLADNPLAATAWSFMTAAPPPPVVPDPVPPTVSAISPANGAAGIAVSTAVEVTFSAPVTGSSVTTATFTLAPSAGGSPVAASVTYDGNLTAVLRPDGALAYDTAYTVNLTSGIVDSAGLALAPHQSGFSTAAAPDLTPPHVTAIVPGNTATGVPVAAAIQVTFHEAVVIGPLDETTFKVSDGGAPLVGAVAYNASTKTATFTPAAPFAYLTTYTVTLGAGIQDLAGNPLTAFTSSFTTVAVPDTAPPAVISISPADGATGIALDTQITALFSEPLNAQTVIPATFQVNDGGVPGTVTYNALTQTARFTPDGGLSNGVTYTVTLGGFIQDLAGNPLGTNVSWQFTTTAAPDVTPPTVVSTTPANGATGISAGLAIVTATFSEPLSAGTVTADTFQLTAGGLPAGGTVTYDAANQKAVFTLAGALATNTVYTATATAGITDLAGIPLAATSWTFTTAAASEVIVPGVTQTVQPDGSTVVGVDLSSLDSTQVADAIGTLQGLLDGTLTTSGPLNVTMTGDPNNPLALEVPLLISRSDVNITVSPSGTITLDGSNVTDPVTGQPIANIVEVSGSNVTLDGINVVSGQVDLITQPGGATSGVVLRNLVLHDAVTDDCINLRDCTDCLIENVRAYRCFKKGLQLTGVTNITVRNVIIGVGDENAGPIACDADDTNNTACMFGSNSPRAFVEIFKSNGGLIDGLTIYASRSGSAGSGSNAPDGSEAFGNGVLLLQSKGDWTFRGVTIHDSALAPGRTPHGMIAVWDHATASTISIENASIHDNASKAFSFSKKPGVDAVINVSQSATANNAGGLIEVLNGPIGCSFTGSTLEGDPSAFCAVVP